MAVLSDAQREAGWTIAKLGDVATVITGQTPSKKFPEHWGEKGEIPFLTPKDQTFGIRSVDTERYISKNYIDIYKKRVVPAGSVALTCIGSSLGKISVTRHVTLTNQQINSIVSDESKSNNLYIYYYLILSYDSLESLAGGTVMPIVNKTSLEGMEIPLPPLEEQERIAGILGSLDDKIEANTRLIQTLDSLGEAVTRKYLKSVQETQKLNDIAHIVMGQSPKGETLNTEGSGVLFFQGKKDFGFRYPTPRTYTTAATRMAEPLDILFSVRAPIGAINRSVEACCVGRGLAAIRSSCGQENTLFYTLKTNPNLWEKFEGEGTIFSAINKKGLSELDIPFSETAISNGVEDFLTSVEQEIFSLEQENLQLAETRDALIKRLIG
ncbi:restriction endonuclease subunit S [Rothia mucilaginosa]|uniref:restriction endonuclease subunit S n=1 Tax=Rothia mucilaginosa TaxID=43675 RepID=UPI0028E58479|nr:restriction endonuclease subunit S [Rothia mucilaginosa]